MAGSALDPVGPHVTQQTRRQCRFGLCQSRGTELNRRRWGIMHHVALGHRARGAGASALGQASSSFIIPDTSNEFTFPTNLAVFIYEPPYIMQFHMPMLSVLNNLVVGEIPLRHGSPRRATGPLETKHDVYIAKHVLKEPMPHTHPRRSESRIFF
eukprot:COSAG02_NODE_13930_length_1329_cov_6.964228_2_plen_154_part_01